MNPNIRGGLYLSLAAAIWGGMYVFSSWVLGEGFIGPFTLLSLRLFVSAALLGAVMMLTGGRRSLAISRPEVREVIVIGVVGYVVSLGAQFMGTKLSGSAHGSLLTGIAPAFIVVFARLFLGEQADARRLAAVALATVGATAIVVPNLAGQSGSLVGDILLVIAGVSWGLYTVLSKRFSARRGALAATFWASVVGVVVNLPLAALEPPPLPAAEWPVLAWVGLVYICVMSTSVAFYMWNAGFELMRANVGSLFFFVQPLVGAGLGWALLDETIGGWFIVGAALIGMGILLSALPQTPTATVLGTTSAGDNSSGQDASR
jgi:drug/metabolite transporter (DMT)-like permease